MSGGTCIVDGNVLVLGDTLAAVVYIFRLLRSGFSGQVFLATEGPDYIGNPSLREADFVPRHHEDMPAFFKTERVRYWGKHIENGTCFRENSDTPRVIEYKYPIGVLGSFISAPIIPRAGNWVPTGDNRRMEDFIRQNTHRFSASQPEHIVLNTLAELLGINIANSPATNQRTGILKNTFPFVNRECGGGVFERNLGIHILKRILCSDQVTLFTGAYNFEFKPKEKTVPGPRRFDIFFETMYGQHAVEDSIFVAKTNPFTLARIVTKSFPEFCVEVPAEYRAKMSIPNTNPVTGVNIDPRKHLGDMVTTYGAFSIGSRKQPAGSSPEFFVEYYTSLHDYFQGANTNLFASHPNGLVHHPGMEFRDLFGCDPNSCSEQETFEGNTLLIVQGINSNLMRKVSYDQTAQVVDVHMATEKGEMCSLKDFVRLALTIKRAYTGDPLPPQPPNLNQFISGGGFTYEHAWITNMITGVTPIAMMLSINTLPSTSPFPHTSFG